MRKSAVLIIDAQVGLVTGAYSEIEVLENINKTTAKVRQDDGIIIFIQHCHSSYEPMMKGSPGWEVHPTLDKKESDFLIEKEASDSFYETSLIDVLKANGVNHVYVTGLQTEFCVDATCRSALSKNLAVTLISDAHTTGDSHLAAPIIIDHHNKILANLAHPKLSIEVRASNEI